MHVSFSSEEISLHSFSGSVIGWMNSSTMLWNWHCDTNVQTEDKVFVTTTTTQPLFLRTLHYPLYSWLVIKFVAFSLIIFRWNELLLLIASLESFGMPSAHSQVIYLPHKRNTNTHRRNINKFDANYFVLKTAYFLLGNVFLLDVDCKVHTSTNKQTNKQTLNRSTTTESLSLSFFVYLE
jgi:hypothetical protein